MTAKELLKRVVPRSALALYHAYRGSRPIHRRTCPVCDFQGWFTHYGRSLRVDAKCPNCGSLERHRLFWLWYQRNELVEPILHFAPEHVFSNRLRAEHSGYQTADLFVSSVDLKLNIESIELADASVQTIICNHVLEHVDDRRALRELFRVLAPGGILVCSVPIVEGWDSTYEEASVTTSQQREIHFGQDDHVRFYGRDFRERLTAAGFRISEFTAEGADVVTYGLQRGDKIFICHRPNSVA